MSLKDIAAMAGVSPSTVSRVLNNPLSSCASPEVRAKIMAAAEKTGYVPSVSARNLRRGEGRSSAPKIAVIMARISAADADPFFDQLALTVESELLNCGCRLGGKLYADGDMVDFGEDCSGCIIVGRCSDKLLENLHSRTEFLAGVWRNRSALPVDQVLCDGKIAAQIAMRHLMTLGHRHIAYIGDCSSESRYIGYCEALISGNAPINYPLVIECRQDRESGKSAMLTLMERGGATAVLCANDIIALGALDALKCYRRSKKSPMSVISIDDISDAKAAHLTTIHIPQKDMAHIVVRMLLDRLEGGHSEHLRVEFPCRLVERESCFMTAEP